MDIAHKVGERGCADVRLWRLEVHRGVYRDVRREVQRGVHRDVYSMNKTVKRGRGCGRCG